MANAHNLWIVLHLSRREGGADGLFTYYHASFCTYGYAWARIEERHLPELDLDHCEKDLALMVYEQLRGIRRAAEIAELSRKEIDDIFCGNAVKHLTGGKPTAH